MSVFGIIGNERTNVASSVYYGLYALQHRGQESCGISVNDDGVIHTYKDTGLVNDVFSSQNLASLGEGTMAIGHVRYGTMGTKGRVNAEPLVVNHTKGHLAIATNGRLVNGSVLKQELELKGMIFHTSSDAEIVSYVVIQERLNSVSIEQAVNKAMDKLKGGFCMLLMSPKKIIAVRDELGMHPLCYGKRENGEYVIASETCALDSVGAVFIRELDPGEILVFSKDGIKSIRDHCGQKPERMCVFEYVYTARPDSTICGCSVHEARKRAGAYLAKAHPVEADVVVGVPDSGLDAAIGYAEESGIPYGIGLIKNKYIGRTFIAPGQNVREDKVKIKLNPVVATVKGKRVVLVDDSIVRGTTCARIVKLLRNAGAKEVHLRCYYGTDVDSKESLIACNHTVEEMSKLFDVDTLGYLPLEDVSKLGISGSCKGYCTACFDGDYPTETPEKYVNKFDHKISENN